MSRIAPEPPPGLNSNDTIYAAPGIWATGSNVRFYQGRPEAIGNDETFPFGGPLVTYTNGRKLLAYKVGGVVKLAVAADNNLYLTSPGGALWTKVDITPASGWAVASSTRHSLDLFGDILLASPTGNTIYKSVLGAQATVIANAPAAITKMIVTPTRQVMALGCNEEVSGTFNGRCIRWCDIEDFDDWTTSSSNNAGEYILPGQENIITGCILGDHIVVWTQGSLWLGQYLGEPGQTYQFTRIDGIGCIAQDAWAIYKGVVYWMDKKFDVYAYQPGGVPTKIPCPINRSFPTVASAQAITAIHAFTRTRFGEIWFFFPSATYGAVYCVDESQNNQRPVWWITAVDSTAIIDDPLLDSSASSDLPFGGAVIRLPGTGNGTVSLTGTDMRISIAGIAWSLTSSAYYINEAQTRVMVKRFAKDFEEQTNSVTLQITTYDDPGGSAIATPSQTVATSDVTKDFRVSGRLMAMTYSGTGKWRLGKPAFEVVEMGER